jgi:hypothetical protein
MIKTQHCPNCETTERKLNDFRQLVSDVVRGYLDACRKLRHSVYGPLESFVISAPKPDPLLDVAESLGYFNTAAQGWAGDVRAALDDLGLEIREKAK